MTQRTHDLAAVALSSFYFLTYPPTALNWETLLGIGVATFLGGMIPDIDNVSSKAWKFNLTPWEDDLTRHSLEGHRNWSHSIIGIGVFTFLLGWVLSTIKLANLIVFPVQLAFFLGYLSHLITDSLTHDGVPWFYPIDIHLGFPPFKSLRMKTGSWIERLVVFPLLLAFTIWIYYVHHGVFTKFLKI